MVLQRAGRNQPQPGQRGLQHIRIAPQVVEDLHWASASVDTIRGTVSSSWSHSPGLITLDVAIPVNSDGQVVIPMEEEMTDVVIREGGREVWKKGHYVGGDPGLTGATQDRRAIIFQVGSGRYSFRLTPGE